MNSDRRGRVARGVEEEIGAECGEGLCVCRLQPARKINVKLDKRPIWMGFILSLGCFNPGVREGVEN